MPSPTLVSLACCPTPNTHKSVGEFRILTFSFFPLHEQRKKQHSVQVLNEQASVFFEFTGSRLCAYWAEPRMEREFTLWTGLILGAADTLFSLRSVAVIGTTFIILLGDWFGKHTCKKVIKESINMKVSFNTRVH